MSWVLQVALGSALLLFCALVHVGVVAVSLPWFKTVNKALAEHSDRVRFSGLLSFAILVVVFAHTVQVWLWAMFFVLVGSFPDFPTSFYFSTVTYTTLGYGDIVLGEGLRIFATFAAITGLLTFGISTAVLLGLLVRILPEDFQPKA